MKKEEGAARCEKPSIIKIRGDLITGYDLRL